MLLAHDWAEWSVWTGTVSGNCLTITWEVVYLPCLHPPCDVDRLCDYMTWQIRGPVVAKTIAPSGALLHAGLHWGSFPRMDSDHGDWLDRLWGRSCRLL